MLLFTVENYRLRLLLKRLSILFIAAVVLTALSGNAAAARGKLKSSQKTFATPENAVQALVLAAKAADIEQLLSILGADGRQLVISGDEVEDRAGLERFVRAYEEKNQIIKRGDKKAVVEVGNEDWPLPMPLVKTDAGVWRFDTKQGKEEILNRRIGKNELSAIQVSLAYVEAQREYASKDRDGDGVLEYAQQFLSDPGNKNGLYWDEKEGGESSPLGPLVGKAKKEGYTKKSDGEPTPYHGYYFKILKAQGKSAPRGAYNYVTNGKMIGGFALVAYPARYGVSGIMTFIVSHDGVLYESNLGNKTASFAQAMTIFSPDRSWRQLKNRHLEFPGKEGGV